MSWNPVTGCLKGCNYCYAKGIAHRFGDAGSETGGLHVLDSPVLVKTKHSKRAEGPIATRRNYFPYGFDPTFHKYRLSLPGSVRVPQKVFVGSMCDLFGDWVPDKWITEVLEACRKVPRHKYIFLTKNPARYLKMIEDGKLLSGDNVWYGATITGMDERIFYADGFNTFLGVEPLLAEVGINSVLKEAGAKWVILGAETGSRTDGSEKVMPKKAWIQGVVDACRDAQVPLFMKHNIESAWGGEMVRQLPERLLL